MANVRIKDITTTASAPNDDDYLAIDGATSGTRKIAADSLGGVSQTEKDLMLQLFYNSAYTSPSMLAVYTQLYNIWHGSVTTTYTVTNTLTHVTTSNIAVSVEENSEYTATLTADEGYEIDSATVTMGGVDITATAYSAGSISISAVTGDLVITASASAVPSVTYLYNWDFTQSLTDSVGGLTAVLHGSASQDSSGLHLNSANDYVILDTTNSIWTSGRTVEFEIGESDGNLGTNHGRLFVVPRSTSDITSGASGAGFIYRNSGKWGAYFGGWTDGTLTDVNGLANKKVKLVKNTNSGAGNVDIYIDGTYYISFGGGADLINYPYINIGSTSQTFHNIAIKSCKIYENEV